MLLIYVELASLKSLEALMSIFAQKLIGLCICLVEVKNAVALDVN